MCTKRCVAAIKETLLLHKQSLFHGRIKGKKQLLKSLHMTFGLSLVILQETSVKWKMVLCSADTKLSTQTII